MRLDVLHFTKPLAPEKFRALVSRVSPERRERIHRFHRWQDAHRALYSRLLLQAVAAESLRVSPDSLSFANDEQGKPALAGHAGFHFNLSHSGSWVACASGDSPLGIDVEHIRPLDPDWLESVLSAEEHLAMEACPTAGQTRQFFIFWTVKESYSKALGLGLALPFHSLTVRFATPGEATVWLDKQPVADWFFHPMHLDAAHPVCLCSRARGFPTFNDWSIEKLMYVFTKYLKRE
jgi:4'-phosphopantetheinyl transferase